MKKLFNFRPAAFFTASLAAGIWIGFIRIKHGDIPLYVALCLFGLAAAASFLFKGKFFSFLSDKKFHIAAFFLAFVLGTMLFSLAFFGFEGEYDGQTARVECDIADSYPSEKGGYFTAKNAVITVGERTIREGNIFVFVEGGYSLPSSGRLSFTARISANRILKEGEINSYAYRNKFRYSFFIQEGDYTVEQGGTLFFSPVRQYIKRTLLSGMGEENAYICYGLAVGDSSYMDDELLEAFGRTGIAHIFSVSGLHITVLSLSVIYLLKLLKIGDKAQFIIVTVFLLVYGGICRFSPPVVRATLMTEFFLLSKVTGKRYDPLSSLFMSALPILLFSPLMLFDAGFLMSYGSVLGIFLLNDRLEKALSFLPRFIRKAACTSLSAQAGLLPVAAHFLSSVSVISIVLNLLIIPLVNACYIALLAMLIIGWIPFLSFIFALPGWGIELVKIVTLFASKVPFASLDVNSLGLGALAFYGLLLIFSKYLFLGKKGKRMVCAVLALIFAAFSALTNIPFFIGYDSVSALPGTSASLITSGGKVYLLCYGGPDIEKIDRVCKRENIGQFEAVFFTDYDDACDFAPQLEKYGAKKYVLPYSDRRMDELALLEADGKIKYLLSGEVCTCESLRFSPYYYGDSYYAGFVDLNGWGVLYFQTASGEAPDYVANNLFQKINLLFAEEMFDSLDGIYSPDALVSCRGRSAGFDADYFYSSRVYGHLIFKLKDDRIVRKYRYV